MLTRVNWTFPSLNLEETSHSADLGYSSRLSSLTRGLPTHGGSVTFSNLPRKEHDRRTKRGKKVIDIWDSIYL
jgi:hypothetical protein